MVIQAEITLEHTSGCAPRVLWLWGTRRDIRRNVASRKVPDLDECVRPLGSIHSTAGCVEACAKGEVRVVGDGTAGILVLIGRVNVAVGGSEITGEGDGGVDDGPGIGVESHDVGGLVVDAFDYVDFAVLSSLV